MNINNTFISSTFGCKINKTVKNQQETSKKETDTTSNEKPDIGFMDAADKLYKRIDNLRMNYISLDRMGARNVVCLASNAICKGNDIHTNLSNIVQGFQAEIGRILCSGCSQEEFESKIKDIEAKMKAAAKEANAKMDILISLSNSLFKLGNIATDMKNNNMDSYTGVDFVKQLIEKLNTKVDNFSKTDTDEDTVNEKISKDLDNIYGKESRKKLEKKKEEFKEKIDDIKCTLQNPNLPDEEINRLKVLLELYTHRIDAIKSILDIFDSFSTPAGDSENQ